MPSLIPNQRRSLKAQFASDAPIGRSETIDRAGSSGSRWHEHMTELAALDVVEPVTENGRTKWVAFIELRWGPGERLREAVRTRYVWSVDSGVGDARRGGVALRGVL